MMKALSLIQPWASLAAWNIKRLETRKWQTGYRGALAIHASATKCERAVNELLRAELVERFGPDWAMVLPRGQVLATCNLTGVVRVEHVRDHLSVMERACGNYADGRFAWQLADVERLDPPVPARGALGLWNWDEDGGPSSAHDLVRAPYQGTLL